MIGAFAMHAKRDLRYRGCRKWTLSFQPPFHVDELPQRSTGSIVSEESYVFRHLEEVGQSQVEGPTFTSEQLHASRNL